MSRRNKIFIFLVILLVLVQACNLPVPNGTQPTATLESPPVVPTEPLVAPTPPPDVYQPPFASYELVSFNVPAIYAGGDYTLPVDLNAVEGVELTELSAAQRNLLSANGFVVLPPEPGRFKEFYHVYESRRYDAMPVFITTDSVYHVYHLIFDKMLRDLERDYFIGTLGGLTSTMLGASYAQYVSLKGTALEEPALRNVAFFAVAAQLLGLPDAVPAEVATLVSAELSLINNASESAFSPIWDRPDLPNDKKLIEDYSQYIPRGHYTRSEALKQYFKTMMWYGRLTFRLRDDFETRRALLLTQTLRTATYNGMPATQLWRDIYEPTTFIVGKADDLSYFEYAGLMDSVFGANADPRAFADETKFALFKIATETLPPPQINSMWVWIWEDTEQATKGFRFMGQRFTLDSYVFGQLIWRKVGTESDPRGLPKALDFFAAQNSAEAYAILDEMGETRYENYNSQLAKVNDELNSLGRDTWTQNLYWSWLYSLQPVIALKGQAYPSFMRTQAWARKDLQTALGSWTELKHDTILYAKQVMAEMGGGGMDEPPHSYVEPNVEAYARLRALANMTRNGLANRSLLSENTAAMLDNLINELVFLQRVAESEVNNIPIEEDDYWHMLYWGGVLESLTLAAADTEDGMSRDLEDQRAALIADVATGLENGNLVALEEAVGDPAIIYVVLPDAPNRLAIGAVFSYYEFSVPPGGRMTDEAWRQMIDTGQAPPQPAWTGLFIAP